MSTARSDAAIDSERELLAIELVPDGETAPHHREPVSAIDLGDVFAEVAFELWRDGASPAQQLSFCVSSRPGGANDSGIFAVAAQDASAGVPRSRAFEFGIEALTAVVARGMARIAELGGAEAQQRVRCRIAACAGPAAPVPGQGVLAGAELAFLEVDTTRVPGLRAALADAADRATREGEVPVLFAAGARERGEIQARAGQDRPEPVETGGLFLGHVLRCRTAGVLFLVEDVLPAADATATRYSLEYSPETWRRIGAVLRARRRSAPSLRILGQVHGHNFTPESEPCADCRSRAVCTTTTAFLSTSDRQWCRAVFPQSPWQISQVFGWNARGERDEAFYGWRGGCLRRRPYNLVGDADVRALLNTGERR